MGDIIPLFAPQREMPLYRIPHRFLVSFLWSVLTLQPRSFARDARVAVTGLRPEPEVLEGEHVPPSGPCLVACNHYSRPGFDAWWLALAITAAVATHRAPDADSEIHWVMTAAWTFPESPWKHRILTPLTRWAFDRVARVYGFVTMPPMPPDPREVEARALAVLRTLRLARQVVQVGGMIGLAPEGQDVSEGLGRPPEGAGRFLALLVETGLPVLPVGVAEAGGRLRVSFGPLFVPEIPPERDERDRMVARQVMAAIVRQLPVVDGQSGDIR
ncbi:MAG: 1-acyl-sn-glycerol-3-phosphate acyltransferase [Anaerolineae bacterium]|nr:1-acyl-sn-glycerol-3-phosphate acyltransferase [Anaerolineae bacterium]